MRRVSAKQDVEVEIDEDEVLKITLSHLYDVFKIPHADCYINTETNMLCYQVCVGGHNNDYEEETVRKASNRDIEVMSVINHLKRKAR